MAAKKMHKVECKFCHHTWIPRKNRKQLSCPKCKSKEWNEPDNRQLNKDQIKDKQSVEIFYEPGTDIAVPGVLGP